MENILLLLSITDDNFLQDHYYILIIIFLVISGILIKKYIDTNGINIVRKNNIQNKIIPIENIMPFRDLPFNDNYKLAFLIAEEYHLSYKRSDIFGAMLLKWILNDNIKLKIIDNGTYKLIRFKLITEPIDQDELALYNIIKEAAKDDYLERNELKEFARSHFYKIELWMDNTFSNQYNILKKCQELINVKNIKNIFGQKEIVTATDKLNEKAMQMAGLKKYFTDFKLVDDKSAIEVKLWREYLIYAQIFSVAKKVAKEFKDMYPEIITVDLIEDLDIITSIYTNLKTEYDNENERIRKKMQKDSSWLERKNRARDYDSGGGGFSSGGGGGGSFGGGGGGGFR